MIFHAISEVVMEQQEALPGRDVGQNSAMEGLGALPAVLSPEAGEACFTDAVLAFWKKRGVWAIGTSMATVLEEIISDKL